MSYLSIFLSIYLYIYLSNFITQSKYNICIYQPGSYHIMPNPEINDGDVESALAIADHVIQGEMRTGAQEINCVINTKFAF